MRGLSSKLISCYSSIKQQGFNRKPRYADIHEVRAEIPTANGMLKWAVVVLSASKGRKNPAPQKRSSLTAGFKNTAPENLNRLLHQRSSCVLFRLWGLPRPGWLRISTKNIGVKGMTRGRLSPPGRFLTWSEHRSKSSRPSAAEQFTPLYIKPVSVSWVCGYSRLTKLTKRMFLVRQSLTSL